MGKGGDKGHGFGDSFGNNAKGDKGGKASERYGKGEGKSDKGGRRGEKGEKGDKDKGKGKRQNIIAKGLRGRVLSFVTGKPSGFIKRMDGERDVFFDFADVVNGEEVNMQDPVEFDVVGGSDDRLYASNVKKLPKDTQLIEEKPGAKSASTPAAAKPGSLTGSISGMAFNLGGPKASAPGSLSASPLTLAPGGKLAPSPAGAPKKEDVDDIDPPSKPDEDGVEWGRIVNVYAAYGFLQPFSSSSSLEQNDIFFRASDVIGMTSNDPGEEGGLLITLPHSRNSNGFKSFWLAKDDHVSFIMSKDNNGKPCAAQIYKERRCGWRYGKSSRSGGGRSESFKDKTKRLFEMDADEVLQNMSLLKEVLEDPEFAAQHLYKVVSLLASSELSEDMRADRLYKHFLDSNVMQTTLRTAILKQSQGGGKHSGTFLEDCLRLLHEITLRSPSSGALRGQLPLEELVDAYEISIREGSSMTRDGLSEEVVQMLTFLQKHFPGEVKLSRVLGVRAPKNIQTAAANATDLIEAVYYQDMPILPTSSEMLDQCAFKIEANMRTYERCEDYIQTHFMLLREDYIEPLRIGTKAFMEGNYSSKDLRVYTGVKVVGMLSTREGIVYRIQLKKENTRSINWEKSKQLMYGSLLCLSDDNFESLIWATVWRRDEGLISTEGQLDVRVPFEPFDDRLSPGKDFSIVENITIYFEAVRHVLVALQCTAPRDVPFQHTLLAPEPDPSPPLYLSLDQDMFHFHNVFNSCQKPEGPQAPRSFKVLQDWPIQDLQTCLDIDPSQLEAVQHAMTHNVALIQGPPGTGKTWVGLKIVQAILENTKSCRQSPILVVCFTNHALDQFLEGIFKYCEKIARIGSRSKSETMRNRNLKELVSGIHPWEEYFHARKAINERRDAIRKNLAEVLKDVDKTVVELADVYDGPKSESLMTETQFNKFYKGYKSYLMEDAKGLPSDIDEVTEELWQKMMKAWLDSSSDFSKIVAPLVLRPTGGGAQGNASGRSRYDHLAASPINVDDDEEAEVETMQNDRQLDVDAMDVNNSAGGGKANTAGGDVVHMLQNAWLKDKEEYLDGLNMEERSLRWEDEDLWKLPIRLRREAYRRWLLQVHHEAREKLPELTHQLERNAENRDTLERARKLAVLREMEVVGMTTTAVSKLRMLLKELRPEIVVVEEAAEVLEAHILTALHARTQHVVLIGDHQQLRPSTAVYRLSTVFHLDVSLFERLIKNKAAHVTLEQQRRMHPSISRLMKPLYPNLRDHHSVSDYPEVMGVNARCFFIKHPHFEDDEGESHSKQNSFEANLIGAFCAHLVRSGYEESQITVLTPYLGQVRILNKKLRRHPSTENIKATAVDNFQGEENDIIVLSLVRSNRARQMGFLAVENRINVALTRAKHGMFIVGNADMLSTHPLWSSIIADLSANNSISDRIPLVHMESGGIFEARSADDIADFLEDPSLEAGDGGKGDYERVVADRWAQLGKDEKGSKGRSKGGRGKGNRDGEKGRGKDSGGFQRESYGGNKDYSRNSYNDTRSSGSAPPRSEIVVPEKKEDRHKEYPAPGQTLANDFPLPRATRDTPAAATGGDQDGGEKKTTDNSEKRAEGGKKSKKDKAANKVVLRWG